MVVQTFPLLALDFMKPKTLRESVKWLNDKQTDVLLITLNKSDKEYMLPTSATGSASAMKSRMNCSRIMN